MRRLPVLLRILESLTAGNAVILATGMEAEKTTNPDHLAYHRRQRKKGLYPGQMKLRIEYKGKVGEWFPWLHVSSKVLKDALRESSWKLQRLIRAKDGHYLAVIGKRKARAT